MAYQYALNRFHCRKGEESLLPCFLCMRDDLYRLDCNGHRRLEEHIFIMHTRKEICEVCEYGLCGSHKEADWMNRKFLRTWTNLDELELPRGHNFIPRRWRTFCSSTYCFLAKKGDEPQTTKGLLNGYCHRCLANSDVPFTNQPRLRSCRSCIEKIYNPAQTKRMTVNDIRKSYTSLSSSSRGCVLHIAYMTGQSCRNSHEVRSLLTAFQALTIY
jgi:hypothetical protein